MSGGPRGTWHAERRQHERGKQHLQSNSRHFTYRFVHYLGRQGSYDGLFRCARCL